MACVIAALSEFEKELGKLTFRKTNAEVTNNPKLFKADEQMELEKAKSSVEPTSNEVEVTLLIPLILRFVPKEQV